MRFPASMNANFLLSAAIACAICTSNSSWAHEWHRHQKLNHNDAQSSEGSSASKNGTETQASDTHKLFVTTAVSEIYKPDIAKYFDSFAKVKTRWDADTLYVESSGLPDHNMMVGIRSWQQQVPLPQPYTGKNAWQIPLHPSLALNPVSTKTNLFRGAIALAVNGVPIFNALNNRGDDALLAGELDEWGGHCGRGDDYHYHVAPTHLEKIVGKGNPIAFALDGFPIFGLTEADGSPVGKLDQYNGQFDASGNYHYHATKTYPYINGGLRGIVTVRGDQIEPQPRDSPVRPALSPLRGATITAFESSDNRSTLTYTLRGQTGTVSYSSVGSTSWKFTYAEPGGRTRVETHERRGQRNGQPGPPPPRKRPRPR